MRLVAESGMAKEKGGKEKILAAIRRAATELGRAPSRGELRRITGVSHYRVLAVFPTLREAVRAAGLEPNPKGEKISTEDLLADWKRVAEKLGRKPSRAEYVREGKYSAGAFVGRFGSWSGIRKNPLTTKDTKEHGGKTRISRESLFHNARRKPLVLRRANYKEPQRGTRSGDLVIGESGDRKAGASRVLSGAELHSHKRNDRSQSSGQPGVRDFDRVPLAAVPAPLVGMHRVTEEVAQMVVNTLLGSKQPSALSIQPRPNPFTTEITEEHRGERSGDLVIGRSGDLRSGGASKLSRQLQNPEPSLRGIKKDRPVMGEPFDRRPMTNAPVNELGVMVLFGMVAAGLGLQVESVQGKFPDCIARRQVAPGKWQHLRIEFEYESKNFKLHGHDPKGCDMIVCWRHNWKDCPAEIEVVELCRLFGMQ